jgi:hypothetical protein
MDELDRINSAIDCFAAAIKSRMADKYYQGHRGWDGEYPVVNLIEEVFADIKDIRRNMPIINFTDSCISVLRRRLVDIGARAMMLWYRPKEAFQPEDSAGIDIDHDCNCIPSLPSRATCPIHGKYNR